MALTDRQLALIRTSFKALRDDPQPRSLEFYENFFRRAPDLREMFRDDDLGGQGMRFMSTLAVIVDNLDHPESISGRYSDLGQAHRFLGVKAEHFQPMGEALIETLSDALGDGFTDEMREAWETAYAQLSRQIIEMGGIPKK